MAQRDRSHAVSRRGGRAMPPPDRRACLSSVQSRFQCRRGVPQEQLCAHQSGFDQTRRHVMERAIPSYGDHGRARAGSRSRRFNRIGRRSRLDDARRTLRLRHESFNDGTYLARAAASGIRVQDKCVHGRQGTLTLGSHGISSRKSVALHSNGLSERDPAGLGHQSGWMWRASNKDPKSSDPCRHAGAQSDRNRIRRGWRGSTCGRYDRRRLSSGGG